jgi:hypothetical protein
MLLTDPSDWDAFIDFRSVEEIPAGSAKVGQVFTGESEPKLFGLRAAFRLLEIDESRRRLAFDVKLPLGVLVHEDLFCVSVNAGRCLVIYGCTCGSPAAWFGAVVQLMMSRASFPGHLIH